VRSPLGRVCVRQDGEKRGHGKCGKDFEGFRKGTGFVAAEESADEGVGFDYFGRQFDCFVVLAGLRYG